MSDARDDARDDADAPAPDPILGPRAAALLVFGSSAAVLVVELVALRLLAPYLGLTLETNTLVIGLALVSIAAGSWWGGRIADVASPRRLLGPLLLWSGAAVAATPFVVRGVAEVDRGSMLLLVAGLAVFVPAASLSAITPAVTKLRLTSLAETGAVVGRLSGIGTVGAVAGTVLTGFVLVSLVPVSVIMVGLGVLLVAAAVAVETSLRMAGGAAGATAVAVAAVGLGGLGAAVGPGGCDVETTYHCAVVTTDPDRASGRTLLLDGARHSYVDLADPLHLDFVYTRALAATIETQVTQGAVDAYHLGAGGLTIPRWLREVRPGTRSVVSEIDPGVVEVNRDRLGWTDPDDVDVRVEDGRLGLGRLADDSQDLVVGDAFGGVSVPWHLTTREAVAEVRRVLRPDGVYAVNLIDYGPQDFVRAELATLLDGFAHVALAGEPRDVGAGSEPGDGGNVVAVASDVPLDPDALVDALAERETGWTAVTDDDLAAFVGDAEVLTDDHAPVDQLLTPYRVA